MDSAIGAAARALAVGDPLHALKYVALRNDARSLALRGIAMAQLGELPSAQNLLRRAEKAFEPSDPVARARCILARAEVALARRDLNGASRGLFAARELLAARGDHENALFAALLDVRRLTLLGEVSDAQVALDQLLLDGAPARLVSLAALATADLAVKRIDGETANAALARAREAAMQSRIPQLLAEVERLALRLASPVARLVRAGEQSPVYLQDLDTFAQPHELLVDGCRREIRWARHVVSLVRRPVLLELVVTLAEHAPSAAPRALLIERAFGARRVTESHRARLRVEVGRLRRLLGDLADVRASKVGYTLSPAKGRELGLLLPPNSGQASALLALLQSGETWATSALAEALGKSQRAVQRALAELEREGHVQALGRGRSQRWVSAPVAGSATTLVLVAPGTL